ncbi:MAG: hypothetical protein R3A52_00405 [Polyangiales bacterium]
MSPERAFYLRGVLAVFAALLVAHGLATLTVLRPHLHHRRVDAVTVERLAAEARWETFDHDAVRDLARWTVHDVERSVVVPVGLVPWDLVAVERASGNDRSIALTARVNRHFREAPTDARCVLDDPPSADHDRVEHARVDGVTLFRCVRVGSRWAVAETRWRFGVRLDSGIGAAVLLALGRVAAVVVSLLLALWASWARASEVHRPVIWELSTEGNDTAYRTADVTEPTPPPVIDGATMTTRLAVLLAWVAALHAIPPLLRAIGWVP